MNKVVKLSRAEQQLINAWHKELMEKRNIYAGILDELLAHRIERLAIDKGINLNDGNWHLDVQGMEFRYTEQPEQVEPVEVIPGRKRCRPTNAKNASDDNIIDVEPELFKEEK